jgi:hypothetical protein
LIDGWKDGSKDGWMDGWTIDDKSFFHTPIFKNISKIDLRLKKLHIFIRYQFCVSLIKFS